jgi:hypothetical protein
MTEHITICELIFTVSSGSSIAPHDSGTVAVIDGSMSLFLSLRAS